jgi:serine/threonine protein kinase
MKGKIQRFLQKQTNQNWKFGEYLVESTFRRDITGVIVYYNETESITEEYIKLKQKMVNEKWELEKRNEKCVVVKYWNAKIETKENIIRRLTEMVMEDWCIRHISMEYEHPIQKKMKNGYNIHNHKYFSLVKKYSNIDKQIGNNVETWIHEIEEDIYILCMPLFGIIDMDKILTDNLRPVEMKTRIKYFCQLSETIGRLHIEHNVAHRDLKLCNVIVDISEDKIWLIDFGHACFIKNSCPWTYTICGTEYMFSPELLKIYIAKINGDKNIQYKNYGVGFDKWSLGIILYELIKWQTFDVRQDYILEWDNKKIRESVWNNELFEVLCSPIPLLRSLFTWESLMNPDFISMYIK